MEWHVLMENVNSMEDENRDTITEILEGVCEPTVYELDAAQIGWISRQRYYWVTFDAARKREDLRFEHETSEGVVHVKAGRRNWIPNLAYFLQEGYKKASMEYSFPTAVCWNPRARPGAKPAARAPR